jgi:hypothetical protein
MNEGHAYCVFFFICTGNPYHTITYTLAKEVVTMVVKLNSKVIDVVENNKEDKEKTITYWCVSTLGYVLVLFIMDMVCYTFFYIHPFPILNWLFTGISGWINFIGGLF